MLGSFIKMCGRFTITEEALAIAEFFSASTPVDAKLRELTPRYNLAPGEEAAVVVGEDGDDGGRRLRAMLWGFGAPERRLINARSESVAERRTFSKAFRRRRCLVPADGFYEWETTPTGKQPYYIRPKNGGLFAMAGIWESASNLGPPTFAVLTQNAPESLAGLHDRVPVILHRPAWGRWLSATTQIEEVQAVLKAVEPPPLHWHAVSRTVNRAGHEEPSLIAEVEVPPPVQRTLF